MTTPEPGQDGPQPTPPAPEPFEGKAEAKASDEAGPKADPGSTPAGAAKSEAPAEGASTSEATAGETPTGGEAKPAEGANREGGAKRARKPRPKKKRENRKGPKQVERAPRGPRPQPAELFHQGLEKLAEGYLGLRERAGLRNPRGGSKGSVQLEIELPLDLAVLRQASADLSNTLRARLEHELILAGRLVPGRAWDFRSESFEDPICRPGDPRQVLVGYGLEGRPRFADLVTLAIERKHENVEALLAGQEGAVAFVEDGKEVTKELVPAFDPDKAPYRLLGQAMIGLFQSSEEGRRVALTVQVLARQHGEDGSTRFHGHLVCAADLVDLPDPSIHRILNGYQRGLDQVARQHEGLCKEGKAEEAQELVLSSLRDLVKQLSHDARNRDRKTAHARERAEESQRPTQFAFSEAQTARDHHLYMDNEERTVVVIGKKGRVHVFSPEGRHVTTVVIPPSKVRARVSQGRWRQAEPQERGSFREAIASSGGERAGTS